MKKSEAQPRFFLFLRFGSEGCGAGGQQKLPARVLKTETEN